MSFETTIRFILRISRNLQRDYDITKHVFGIYVYSYQVLDQPSKVFSDEAWINVSGKTNFFRKLNN